jgi:hypothetical protein
VALAAITLLAAGVRFYGLGDRSLWTDEIYTAGLAQVPSLATMLSQVGGDQSPLSYVFFWLAGRISHSDAWLRVPAAIESSLQVPLLGLVGFRLAGWRVGLLAAALAAVLPFDLWFAQDARPYSLLLLLTTLQLLFLLDALRQGRARDWVALAVVSAASLYTHYTGVGALLATYACVGGLLVLRLISSRSLAAIALQSVAAFDSLVLVGVAYLPWAGSFSNFLRVSGADRLGTGVLDAGYAACLARGIVDAIGLGWPLLLLLLVGVAAAARNAARDRDLLALLPAAWLLFGFGIVVARFGVHTVLLHPRYFTDLIPAVLLLVALGIEGLAAALLSRSFGGRFTTLAAGLLGIAVVAALLPASLATLRMPKSDYRDAAGFLVANARPGTAALALGDAGSRGFAVNGVSYYLQQRKAPASIVDPGEGQVARVLQETQSGSVWGVAYHLDEGWSVSQLPPELAAHVARIKQYPHLAVIEFTAETHAQPPADTIGTPAPDQRCGRVTLA